MGRNPLHAHGFWPYAQSDDILEAHCNTILSETVKHCRANSRMLVLGQKNVTL